MEKASFDLVRRILRSQQFQSKNLEEQKKVIEDILRTGEITADEILMLFDEQQAEQQAEYRAKGQNQIGGSIDEGFVKFLNGLDYNTFLNFIQNGDINGQDLINLCSSSKKLNEYCNRSFQPLMAQGQVYGEEQTQYLFRLLLNKAGFRIPKGRSPRALYIKKFVRTFTHFGYSDIKNNNHSFRLGTQKDKEISEQNGESIYRGKDCHSLSVKALEEYLWSVKVDLYVRVIMAKYGGNIFLIRLNSSDINDITMKQDGTPEIISLYEENLPSEDLTAFDNVVHYTEIYPEILNWVFEDEVSQLNIPQLANNPLFYPTLPDSPENVPLNNPRLVRVPYLRTPANDATGMLRLLSDNMRNQIYGNSWNPGHSSIVEKSLLTLFELFLIPDRARNEKHPAIYNADNKSKDRFLEVWDINKTILCRLIFLAFFLEGSLIKL
jgi:hypothetical protein